MKPVIILFVLLIAVTASAYRQLDCCTVDYSLAKSKQCAQEGELTLMYCVETVKSNTMPDTPARTRGLMKCCEEANNYMKSCK